VFSKSRTRDIVRTRSILYNLLHEEYNISISSIGRVFGQDHTTVLHSTKSISKISLDIGELNILYGKSILNLKSELLPITTSS
jgi:chromosomal replication initiation ATPase DnaA